MKKTCLCILAFLLSVLQTIAQDKVPTCYDLHEGVYHEYSKYLGDHIISTLKENSVQAIAVNLDDTVYYKISWTNDCNYTLQYLSGGKRLPPELLKFNKEHIFYHSIQQVTSEYFIAKMRVDKPKGRIVNEDTTWLREKNLVMSGLLAEKISGPYVNLRKIKTDSSSALVYIYRPGRTLLLLASYPLYLNDQPICLVKNKSGFIFRIKKEGHYRFHTSLMKDSSAMEIDIRFGQKYYIKPLIDWGIKKHGYNFKLRFEKPLNEGLAEQEFELVNLE